MDSPNDFYINTVEKRRLSLRPHHVDTGFRTINEVKQHLAWSVSSWVTA